MQKEDEQIKRKFSCLVRSIAKDALENGDNEDKVKPTPKVGGEEDGNDGKGGSIDVESLKKTLQKFLQNDFWAKYYGSAPSVAKELIAVEMYVADNDISDMTELEKLQDEIEESMEDEDRKYIAENSPSRYERKHFSEGGSAGAEGGADDEGEKTSQVDKTDKPDNQGEVTENDNPTEKNVESENDEEVQSEVDGDDLKIGGGNPKGGNGEEDDDEDKDKPKEQV